MKHFQPAGRRGEFFAGYIETYFCFMDSSIYIKTVLFTMMLCLQSLREICGHNEGTKCQITISKPGILLLNIGFVLN